MSSDNDSRKQAEEYFVAQQNSNLSELLSTLLSIIGSKNEVQATPSFCIIAKPFTTVMYIGSDLVLQDLMIRSLAGILLRRTIDPTSPHGSQIDDNTTSQIRTELMNIWAGETNHMILRRLSHVIAQSASNGNWVDLIPAIVSHSSTVTDPNGLISLLNIIEILADYCPGDILTHAACLISFLGEHLSADSLSVQTAAAKATGACIVSLEDDTARAAFKPAGESIREVICEWDGVD